RHPQRSPDGRRFRDRWSQKSGTLRAGVRIAAVSDQQACPPIFHPFCLFEFAWPPDGILNDHGTAVVFATACHKNRGHSGLASESPQYPISRRVPRFFTRSACSNSPGRPATGRNSGLTNPVTTQKTRFNWVLAKNHLTSRSTLEF